METPESLGERIRKRREELGLRQVDLANRLGVTEQYISLLEKNQRSCSLKTLLDLAETLGVNSDYLLRGRESYTTANLELVIRSDKSFSPRAKRVLLDLIEILRKK